MKNHRFAWLIVMLVGLAALAAHPQAARAQHLILFQVDRHILTDPQIAQTPSPTVQPSMAETSEARVLPSVGGNAGLVLGATVLVIIIIGGVIISSRWRSKH